MSASPSVPVDRHGDFATRLDIGPDDGSNQLGSPGPDQTTQSDDLAGPHVEVDVIHHVGTDSTSAQDYLARNRFTVRLQIELQLAADHLVDQFVGFGLRNRDGVDELAVS